MGTDHLDGPSIEQAPAAVPAAPSESFEVRGATGPSAGAINGRYKLVEELSQGRPVWQKDDDKNKWLLRFSNGFWYVAETERKVSGKPGGFMRSAKQGQLFPHAAGPRRVWTGS